MLNEVPEGPHPEVDEETHQDEIMYRFTGWTTLQIKHQAVFEVFDKLPVIMRRTLWQLTITFDPVPISDYWNRNQHQVPAQNVVTMIHAGERDDLREFAFRYLRRYGTVLPHVAAGVSVQRYGRFAY